MEAGAEAPASASGPAGSFVRAAQTVLGSLLQVLETRIELLSVEVEEEWLRIATLLAVGLAALFCVGMAIMLLAVLFIAAFWDSYRLLAIGACAVTFGIAGWVCWRSLVNRYKSKPRLFAASLDELRKDQALVSTAGQ